MKIPKKIMKLLDRKYKLAMNLVRVSDEIDTWLQKNGAKLEDDNLNNAVLTGCYIYCEPEAARKVVIDYIENEM